VAFDVTRVRAAYPALADGYAYLDGAAGTQVPESVITAIGRAYRAGLGNTDGAFPASARSDAIMRRCREAVADLVGGVPEGVVLGPNMTTLTYRIAAALAVTWRRGDEVIVSRLDHDANVRPWVQAAGRTGAVVRWAEIDAATGELPAEQFASLLCDRTRLVAVTAASNIIGTRPDVATITGMARAAGALSYVDGVDLAMVDTVWLRRQVGVVLQDNVLFNRSVRDNIALADPAMSIDRVIAAAQLAGAHEFILEMPEAYDTIIGERGSSLSGGQRQRIAIARALVMDPRILIFDEATSSLDYASERVIQFNMQQIAHGRTVFIIAHRLSTVRHTDRILTVERGRIVEDGTHDELVRTGGRYAMLHRMQAGIQEIV